MREPDGLMHRAREEQSSDSSAPRHRRVLAVVIHESQSPILERISSARLLPPSRPAETCSITTSSAQIYKCERLPSCVLCQEHPRRLTRFPFGRGGPGGGTAPLAPGSSSCFILPLAGSSVMFPTVNHAAAR